VPALGVVGKATVTLAARTATGSLHQARVRAGLAVAQVCVALLLIIVAGLLGKSIVGLAATPLGIDVESVLLFETHLTHVPQAAKEDEESHRARLTAQRDLYVDRLQERLAGLPDVRGVGAVSQLPLSHDMGIMAHMRVPETPEEESTYATYLQATAGYFDAIGIGLVAGRSFASFPAASKEEVVLSRKTAEELFGTVDVVGREVLLNSDRQWRPRTVVGVVEDVRIHGPDEDARNAVYLSLYDSLDLQLGFAVRAAGDPRLLADRVTAALAEVDPGIPPFEMRTSRQALSHELSARQALALVSSLFAISAMILAAIGIYGLLAEAVARRRREIGIRMALGAPARALVSAVAGRGFVLVVCGVLLALPVTWLGSNALEGVLFGVSPRDPWVLGAAPLLLIAVATLAAWLPALRAARVDPVEVLSAQ
jgi:predicted permease